jgi:hypothetical protein
MWALKLPGFFYGELHGVDTKNDLAGFLARAWAKKADHFMHGLPEILNIPSVVHKDQFYCGGIEFVAKHGGVALGDLPSGFSAGVHAVRLFENQVEQHLYYPGSGNRIQLEVIQSCSAAISNRASMSAFMCLEAWDKVPDPPASFADAINSLYRAYPVSSQAMERTPQMARISTGRRRYGKRGPPGGFVPHF